MKPNGTLMRIGANSLNEQDYPANMKRCSDTDISEFISVKQARRENQYSVISPTELPTEWLGGGKAGEDDTVNFTRIDAALPMFSRMRSPSFTARPTAHRATLSM